jgi:integrase
LRIEDSRGRPAKRVLLKTKRSRRVIEVTPNLIARLRQHKLATRYSDGHDFVFATRTGTAHDQRNIGGRVLGRAVKRAGLGPVERNGEVIEPAPTFHDLRHSHASALIAAGWDIAEVSARLGHASVSTTMNIYVRQFDAARRSDDRRARLALLYGEAQGEAPGSTAAHQAPEPVGAEVRLLQGQR